MKYVLDTNICIFIIRKKSNLVLQRLRQQAVGEVVVSTVTLAELRYGADKSQDPSANHAALDAFLAPLQVVDSDSHAADRYGGVRADLERRGVSIGPLDTMIAGHALSLGITLVTNNVREFSRVTGLTVEDWMAP